MYTQFSDVRIKDLGNLDQELINSNSFPFTTATCNYVFLGGFCLETSSVRKENVDKLFSLITDISRVYPPKADIDISGIEEIYE